MSEFDVIVIGGGPAGCYAALTAAVNGVRVAVFEEHRAIGWPRHDPGWLMESQFAESISGVMGKAISCIKVKEYRVSDPESGELIEKSKLGGYLTRRDLLEKEIAALAIRAGAKLYLKTKVVKLIKKQGKVEGIETNSDIIPRVGGEIFICADGIRSAGNGFAVKEGLVERGEVKAGVRYILANAEVSAGVNEHFISSNPLFNFRTFFTHGENASFFSVPSFKAFQELKERDDNVISGKIKNAFPLEISGFATATSGKYGDYFNNIIQGNLLFIGDASGGSGNVHGMIQGKFAGAVAASAIKEKDISKERLSEYQDAVFKTLRKVPFCWFSAREDFGSYNNWFHQFRETTKGIKATELASFK